MKYSLMAKMDYEMENSIAAYNLSVDTRSESARITAYQYHELDKDPPSSQ